ncbi:hypothetical protein VTH06DRAFT_8068 [Thermothelomyces fergusii]
MRSLLPPVPLFPLSLSLLLSASLLLFFPVAAAQHPGRAHPETRQEDAAANATNAGPSVFRPPPASGYVYHGCYNETTGLPGTAGARALHDGTNLVRPDTMTVEACLDFCRTGAGDARGGTTGRFRFAGLEYSRECWCGHTLSSLSVKLPDDECDLPCDGNATQACGGSLKLTVYMAGAATVRIAWSAGLAVMGAALLALFS